MMMMMMMTHKKTHLSVLSSQGYEADSPANAGLLDEEKYLPMDGEDHHMRWIHIHA